ncbi:hypothetical protein [Novipirellula artificiosorum]|uniref:Uncharacterized protein n=1 Tax=Novipirellula artificiosorum TaxID=2528016 RepID=A0A5C6DF99_9BACT|nr:hypothetical protein [Novipirellula artificiosorum]TWU33806.1 hypothetical protein Poly41_48050 [Novipirellula artificiosorum]
MPEQPDQIGSLLLPTDTTMHANSDDLWYEITTSSTLGESGHAVVVMAGDAYPQEIALPDRRTDIAASDDSGIELTESQLDQLVGLFQSIFNRVASQFVSREEFDEIVDRVSTEIEMLSLGDDAQQWGLEDVKVKLEEVHVELEEMNVELEEMNAILNSHTYRADGIQRRLHAHGL